MCPASTTSRLLGAALTLLATLLPAGCGEGTSPGPVDVSDVGGADSSEPSDASTGPGPEDAAEADGISEADSVTADASDGVGPGSGGASVDVVAPPDGFPVADGAACPAGTECLLPRMSSCELAVCNGLGQCVPSGRKPGCCSQDGDCADLLPSHPCEVFECQSGQCLGVLLPGCCGDDEDCDDGSGCTVDTCSAPGASCAHCPNWACDCPTLQPAWSSSFQGSLSGADSGWTTTDFQPGDDITWRLSERRFISAPTAAWVGHPTCPTYHAGALDADCQPASPSSTAVKAELKSATIPLPEQPGGYIALFWVWADVEPVAAGGGSERDLLTVRVEDQLTLEIWPLTTTLEVGKSTSGLWRQLGADLFPWRGRQVRLIFRFDTLDGTDNHHEGVYIDDLTVVARCSGGCCEVDADCSELAVTDSCSTARCVVLSDGSGAICHAVPKDPGGGCAACTEATTCDDANPCTSDLCAEEGVCLHEPFCCFEQAVREDGFEGGLADWYVSDLAPGDGVGWTTTDDAAVAGQLSAWLGNPITGTYSASEDGLPGDAVHASITTTTFTMPGSTPGSSLGARFWLSLSTEWDAQPVYDNPLGVDRLALEVLVAGEQHLVWTSDDVEGSTSGLWVPIVVDLAEWADQAIQLRFTFDTLDGTGNAFGGPFIDEFHAGRVCP